MKSLLFAALILCAAAFTATETRAIGDGPVGGIDVGLDGIPGGRITQGKTDAKGAVTFPKLKMGNYNIAIGSTKVPCLVTVTGGTKRVARELPASGGKIPVAIPRAGGSLTVTITTVR